LDRWPEREPLVFSAEQRLLLWIPQALAAADFIENVTGLNYKFQRGQPAGFEPAI